MVTVNNTTPEWKSYMTTGNVADIVSSPTVAKAIGGKIDAIDGESEGLSIVGGVIDSSTTLDGVTASSLLQKISNAFRAPADKANSIMTTGFNEFDYDTKIQLDANGNTYNGALDQYVNGVKPASCKANFLYMIEQDLAKVPSIDTMMMWVQWFSTCTDDSGTDPGNIEPGINKTIAANLAESTQWSAGGVTSGDALKLLGQSGGSPNDASLLAGMRHLQSIGRSVGFAPIVLGNYADTSSSSELVWRGYFTFSTDALAQAWFDSYLTFFTYYINLFVTSGIDLKRCVVGSEFESFVTTASDSQFSMFAKCMQSCAALVKESFPDCAVSYAANYTEYGVGGLFRLDALWMHAAFDEVGIDWYFPLTVGITSEWHDINAGLVGGEDMYFTIDASDTKQLTAATSSGEGKTGLTQTAIEPTVGIKNALGFYECRHYLSEAGSGIAAPTPNVGYVRGYDPYGLPLMQGTASLGLASAITAIGASGCHPALPEKSTYLVCNGTSTYGQVTVPTIPSSGQLSYEVTLNYQMTAAPSANYARLLCLEGVFEVLADTSSSGGIKLGIGPSTGEYELVISPVDTDYHTLAFSLNLSTLILTVTIDGTATDYTVGSAAAVAITEATTITLGAYDTNNNFAPVHIATFGLNIVYASATYGGTYHFDEAYSGVRTPWVPKAKPLSLTELGFASIGGTCVQPNVFPTATSGTTMAIPSILDTTTKELWAAFMAKGWTPSAMNGPFGSNYCWAQDEQYAAYDATFSFLEPLVRRGVVSNVTIYNIDARPFSAMTALVSSGTLFYSDAPLSVFNHAINGKIVGGDISVYNSIRNNGTIF